MTPEVDLNHSAFGRGDGQGAVGANVVGQHVRPAFIQHEGAGVPGIGDIRVDLHSLNGRLGRIVRDQAVRFLCESRWSSPATAYQRDAQHQG